MRISDSLKPLLTPISSLKLDPKNARLHDTTSIKAIAQSLKDFGQQKAIVALEDGTVIAGNGTLLAAKQLGAARIAVVRWHGTYETAKAFAIADNRTAELSSWDTKELAKQIAELDDWESEAYDFGSLLDEAAAAVAESSQIDEVAEQESAKPPPKAGESKVGGTASKAPTLKFNVSVTYQEHAVLTSGLRSARKVFPDANGNSGRLHEICAWFERTQCKGLAPKEEA